MRTAGRTRLIVVVTINDTEVTVTVVRVYDPLRD